MLKSRNSNEWSDFLLNRKQKFTELSEVYLSKSGSLFLLKLNCYYYYPFIFIFTYDIFLQSPSILIGIVLLSSEFFLIFFLHVTIFNYLILMDGLI